MSKAKAFSITQSLEKYNDLLQLLLLCLTKRLIKFYINEECNEVNFANSFTKIVKGLREIEDKQCLDPKFSQSVKQLEQHIKAPQQNNIPHYNIEKFQTYQTYQTPQNIDNESSKRRYSVQRKRHKSTSSYKKQEEDFRKQLLLMDEQLQENKYIIRQVRKGLDR